MEIIEKIEAKSEFRTFLKRIGFRDFAEYMELFGDDREKRQIATKRFLETYQHKNERITNDTKCA